MIELKSTCRKAISAADVDYLALQGGGEVPWIYLNAAAH
jgi:hypothetical protein